MEAHGCPLRGLAAYPELVDQVRRFRTAGWGAVEAVDALTYFYRYVLCPRGGTDGLTCIHCPAQAPC